LGYGRATSGTLFIAAQHTCGKLSKRQSSDSEGFSESHWAIQPP
jgi:hypothetical protein